jgi:hypothetical protein
VLEKSGIRRSFLQLQNVPTTRKEWLFSRFCVRLWAFEEPISRTPSNIQDLEWCDYRFLWWLDDWASVVELWRVDPHKRRHQHFRANSCDRTAWAEQIMELCFSYFGSRNFFRRTTNGASVDRSTSTNIAKTSVDVSHWFFPDNRECYQSTLLVLHIIRRLHFEALL